MADLPPRRTLIFLAALGVVGAALRMWNLGAESLWQDEAWTWGLAQGNPKDLIFRLARFDAHPPLYYFLVQCWGQISMSDGWIRMLSAVLGLAAIPAMYRLAFQLGGLRAGLVAATLLTLSPYHVYYSREARSYALLFLLCLVSLDLLLRLATAPSRKHWIAFAALTTAIPLTHYMGVFFIAGEVVLVGLLWRERPAFLKEFVIASAGAFGLFLPWLPTAYVHVTTVSAGFWLTFPTLSEITFSMCSLVVSPFFMGTLGYWLAGAFYGVAMGSPRSRRDVALLLLLLIPPVGELLVSLHRPLFYTQTFQYILIPLIALIGLGLARLRPLPCAAACAALGLALLPGLYRTETQLVKEDWRGAVAWIAAGLQPQERIVVQPGFVGIGLERYGERAAWMDRIRLVEGGDMFRSGTPRQAIREELRSQASGLWLVFRHGGDEGWFEWLAPEFNRVASFTSRGVEVHHYVRR